MGGVNGYFWIGYSQMNNSVQFGTRDGKGLAVTNASIPTGSISTQQTIDNVYRYGVGQYLFGSTPNTINNKLKVLFESVSWSTLPQAKEFLPSDVRYFWQYLDNFTGLPYQSLYSNCGENDGSYIVFFFDKVQGFLALPLDFLLLVSKKIGTTLIILLLINTIYLLCKSRTVQAHHIMVFMSITMPTAQHRTPLLWGL